MPKLRLDKGIKILSANTNYIQNGGDFMAGKNMEETMYFQVAKEEELNARDVLFSVYGALKEKGYNPINQIVGYIMSGDPTYITSHKNARSLIMKVERDEILEELMRVYIDTRLK